MRDEMLEFNNGKLVESSAVQAQMEDTVEQMFSGVAPNEK